MRNGTRQDKAKEKERRYKKQEHFHTSNAAKHEVTSPLESVTKLNGRMEEKEETGERP
jgi:hypothetical protein